MTIDVLMGRCCNDGTDCRDEREEASAMDQDLESFRTSVEHVVYHHPVVMDNTYTKWFAKGEATRGDGQAPACHAEHALFLRRAASHLRGGGRLDCRGSLLRRRALGGGGVLEGAHRRAQGLQGARMPDAAARVLDLA